MDFEQQIEARKKLVLSAKIAYSHGLPRNEWESATEIQEFVLKTGLPYDTPKHVAIWVWSFRR